jgi:hypothetical protein
MIGDPSKWKLPDGTMRFAIGGSFGDSAATFARYSAPTIGFNDEKSYPSARTGFRVVIETSEVPRFGFIETWAKLLLNNRTGRSIELFLGDPEKGFFDDPVLLKPGVGGVPCRTRGSYNYIIIRDPIDGTKQEVGWKDFGLLTAAEATITINDSTLSMSVSGFDQSIK